MKTCSKCGEEKELSEFGKLKLGKNGLRPNCKKCSNNYAKKWRNLHHEYMSNYYSEHVEKSNEYMKVWNYENPEKLKEYKKKWAVANPEKNRKWAVANPEKYLYAQQKYMLKNQICETPLPELVEVKFLIYKTNKLCKTLKN
jgi:hypothetical protein